MNTIYFQGDVILYPVDAPTGESNASTKLVRIEHDGHYVVARGEGHHQHVLRGRSRESFQVFEEEPDRTVVLFNERCDFLHETTDGSPGEHLPIVVEPGAYEVMREREVDYFEEAASRIRRVSD